MQWYPPALLRLVLPGVLIVAAMLARNYLSLLGDDARLLLVNLPYLLCLIAVVVAYQFNRGRLLLAAVALSTFYWLVQQRLQLSLEDPATARAYLALSLALPLLGLYLLLIPERGVRNLSGVAMFAAFVLLALLIAVAGPLLSQVTPAAAQYYAPWPWESHVMSRGATLLLGLAVSAGIVLLGLRNEEADAALVGVLCALYLSLTLLYLEAVSVAMGIAASAVLLWGVLRSSRAMAYRDELTGLPGRRALNERLKLLRRNYTIAMVDIDHFKRCNDTHGHDVGDEVLRLVASRLRRVRGGTAYRYGGEEFCIIFARQSLTDSVRALDAMREEIAACHMTLRDRSVRPARAREGVRRRGATRLGRGEVKVTVSAGVAARSDALADPQAVLKAADARLYRAKKSGRNRVAC